MLFPDFPVHHPVNNLKAINLVIIPPKNPSKFHSMDQGVIRLLRASYKVSSVLYQRLIRRNLFLYFPHWRYENAANEVGEQSLANQRFSFEAFLKTNKKLLCGMTIIPLTFLKPKLSEDKHKAVILDDDDHFKVLKSKVFGRQTESCHLGWLGMSVS